MTTLFADPTLNQAYLAEVVHLKHLAEKDAPSDFFWRLSDSKVGRFFFIEAAKKHLCQKFSLNYNLAVYPDYWSSQSERSKFLCLDFNIISKKSKTVTIITPMRHLIDDIENYCKVMDIFCLRSDDYEGSAAEILIEDAFEYFFS